MSPYPLSVDSEWRVRDDIVHRHETVNPPKLRDVTIMLVDDEPHLRVLLSRVLSREGYQIVVAGDGVEALDLVERNRHLSVELLITDLDMPRLGGADLAKRMRAANRVQRVIFMTGNATTLPSSEEMGCALLLKPFNLKALASVVHEVLAQ